METRLDFEWTPLMFAVNLANYHMAKLLLDRGASVNFINGSYLLNYMYFMMCTEEYCNFQKRVSQGRVGETESEIIRQV